MTIADRVVVMRDGSLVGEKLVRDITVNEIITLMVGREIKQLFGKESTDRTISKEYAFEVKDLCARGLYHDVSFGARGGRTRSKTGSPMSPRTAKGSASTWTIPSARTCWSCR